MTSEQIMHLVAGGVILISGTITIIAIRRFEKSERPSDKDPEILTGEHLKVKKRIKELDLDIPPRTRIVKNDERKP